MTTRVILAAILLLLAACLLVGWTALAASPVAGARRGADRPGIGRVAAPTASAKPERAAAYPPPGYDMGLPPYPPPAPVAYPYPGPVEYPTPWWTPLPMKTPTAAPVTP